MKCHPVTPKAKLKYQNKKFLKLIPDTSMTT